MKQKQKTKQVVWMTDPQDGRRRASTRMLTDPSEIVSVVGGGAGATTSSLTTAAHVIVAVNDDDDDDNNNNNKSEVEDDINNEAAAAFFSRRDIRWNDRGNFYYERMREKCRLPSLVATGRHAGRSMVRMRGRSLFFLWTFDMFTSLVEMPWRYLIVFISALYLSSFLLFALIWFALSRIHGHACLAGFENHGFNASLIFSVATQMTIGYGTRQIKGSCRVATFVLILQSLTGIFIDALCLGLIFARITDPKHRTRSIFVSDGACIACRDGALTFMFRVGDARDRKVISPTVRAVLYTWQGRRTHEGESLPVVAQPMEINYRDDLMLIPITIEHVIDEKSPLYGHTHDSLVACGAEVVVSFEGSIDTTGLNFSARQSYLPNEILWGHTFVRIIHQARPGEIHHRVNLRRFHELEPQRMLSSDSCVARCGVQCGGRALLTAQQMSEATLEAARDGGKGTVPFPAIGTNTLVLSDSLVLTLKKDNATMITDQPPPAAITTTTAPALLYGKSKIVTSPAASTCTALTSDDTTSSPDEIAVAPTPAPAPRTDSILVDGSSSSCSHPVVRHPKPQLLRPHPRALEKTPGILRSKLAFRVGDSRSPLGSQIVGVEVRAYLHRWRGGGNSTSGDGGGQQHESYELALTPRGGLASTSLEHGGGGDGGCRLSLWTPVTVEHIVDENSPLRSALVVDQSLARGNNLMIYRDKEVDDDDDDDNDDDDDDSLDDESNNALLPEAVEWDVGDTMEMAEENSTLLSSRSSLPTSSSERRRRKKKRIDLPSQPGLRLALDAEIVVVAEGTLHSGLPCVRRRCYRGRDIRFGHTFAPIVLPPSRRTLWSEPRVEFQSFHKTIPNSS